MGEHTGRLLPYGILPVGGGSARYMIVDASLRPVIDWDETFEPISCETEEEAIQLAKVMNTEAEAEAEED